MAKATNEFEKMSFEELVKYEIPDDMTSEEWKKYESSVKNKAPKYFIQLDFCQLQEFYRTYSGDGVDPWFEAWDKAICESYPFQGIIERIATIERSLSVLLKEHESEPAKITIGQLNRLKNGL